MRTNVDNLSVLYLRNKSDFYRNSTRIDINKSIIKNIPITSEVWSLEKINSSNTLYHINFGDWISWFLSELNGVDATEIDVINYLKEELSKFKYAICKIQRYRFNRV